MNGAGKNDHVRLFHFLVVEIDIAVFAFIIADVVQTALAAAQAASLDVDVHQINDVDLSAEVAGKGLNHGVDIACRLLSVFYHQNPFARGIHVGCRLFPVDR